MPTRLVWPSRVTTGSRRGSVRPPSGISQTCREEASESWALQYQIPAWSALLARVPTTTHHDCAILGATGNDIIIVWAPGDVQHRGCVATDRGHVLVHTSSLEDTAGPLREVRLPSKLNPTSPHPFSAAQRGRLQDPWEVEQGPGGRVWSLVCPRPGLSGQLRRAGHRKHGLGV